MAAVFNFWLRNLGYSSNFTPSINFFSTTQHLWLYNISPLWCCQGYRWDTHMHRWQSNLVKPPQGQQWWLSGEKSYYLVKAVSHFNHLFDKNTLNVIWIYIHTNLGYSWLCFQSLHCVRRGFLCLTVSVNHSCIAYTKAARLGYHY